MFYIQRKAEGVLETVDEFESKKDALEAIIEYRLSDSYAIYYMSRKKCLNCKETSK